MHPMMTIGIRAARKAGDIISRAADRLDDLEVQAKSNNDFVSDIDRRAEAAIIDIIQQSYPDHAFLAEESGPTGQSDHVWIIDPLDGTTNFLHGFPVYAVSIALRINGRIELGIIYDPMRQELFTAERGGGVMLDGKRLRVGNRRELSQCLVGTGFPFRDSANLDKYLPLLRSMLENTQGVRRPGAAALDLAYVAAGRLDGFFETGLQIWDIAAGALMVQEAGGLVGSLDAGTDHFESGNILAANPRIFAQMAKLFKPLL